VTTRKQEIPKPSPPKAAPKPSYSQVTRATPRARDPGKISPDLSCVQACDHTYDPACDTSRDELVPSGSCDIRTRDPGNLSHDLPRDWSSIQTRDYTWLQGQMRFCHASSPLIGTWKTVGTINSVSNNQPSHKTSLRSTMTQPCSTMTQVRSTKAHPCTIIGPALKYGPPV